MMQKLTEEDRMVITRSVVNLLEDWGLQARDMMRVLDMPETVKVRSFGRFRDATPFPDDPSVMKRIHYLLRIAEALRTTHPRNPQMGTRWLRQANRRLGMRSPLAIMVEGGEPGLIKVLSELDCTYAWDATGSRDS